MVDGSGVSVLRELALELFVKGEDGALGARVHVAGAAATGGEGLGCLCVVAGGGEVDASGRTGGVAAPGHGGGCLDPVAGSSTASGEVV